MWEYSVVFVIISTGVDSCLCTWKSSGTVHSAGDLLVTHLSSEANDWRGGGGGGGAIASFLIFPGFLLYEVMKSWKETWANVCLPGKEVLGESLEIYISLNHGIGIVLLLVGGNQYWTCFFFFQGTNEPQVSHFLFHRAHGKGKVLQRLMLEFRVRASLEYYKLLSMTGFDCTTYD